MHLLKTSKDLPKRPRRRHVTILDHFGSLLTILRAPQRYLNHAEWGPSLNSSSRVPFMLGPGKRANHIIEVAKNSPGRSLLLFKAPRWSLLFFKGLSAIP